MIQTADSIRIVAAELRYGPPEEGPPMGSLSSSEAWEGSPPASRQSRDLSRRKSEARSRKRAANKPALNTAIPRSGIV